MKNPYKFQTHLQRISDFLLCGKGIWWSSDETSVIFYDVTDRPVTSTAGPPLHHVRSYFEKEETNYICKSWEKCISEFNKQNLQLPIHKIKCYKEKQLTIYSDLKMKVMMI
jgi:hypothetical protein